MGPGDTPFAWHSMEAEPGGKREVTYYMRSIGLLITRVIFGSYVAVHGAQKLFGSFGGRGLATTGTAFESLGLRPGQVMAALAGASELGGGVLTATGVASPLGPLALAGTMAVDSVTRRKQGALAENGGYELPLTNFAVAVALLTTGPGKLRLGPRLSRSKTALATLGGLAMAATSITQILRARPPTPAKPPTPPSPPA
jgi:putative oxidoreductase